MRDGHQSLLATRMRSLDMIKRRARLCRGPAGALLAGMLGRRDLRRGLSLPAGMPVAAAARSSRGDAQHHDADAAARRQRRGLHQLSRQCGARHFVVKQAAETGVDVFRVFDSLNWVENMRVSMDAVLETGKLCEGAICYTGDILDPAGEIRPEILCRSGQGAGRPPAPISWAEGHGGLLKPAAARCCSRR
jgi:pyruvate carboxylase